jgi:hypothetical protein
LRPSRFQSWVNASVLMASLTMLLLGNTPSAAVENTGALPFAAEIAWASDCQTVGGAMCGAPAFSASNVAPVEFPETPLGPLWGNERLAGTWAARQFTLEDGQPQAGMAQGIPLVDDQTTPSTDEKPTGAKVPEPATMVLLGMGMITISRVARTRRQTRPSRPVRRSVSKYQPGPSAV